MEKAYFSGPSRFDNSYGDDSCYWDKEQEYNKYCCKDNHYHYHKWECDKKDKHDKCDKHDKHDKCDKHNKHDKPEKRKDPSFLAAVANTPTGTPTGDITLQFNSLTGAGGENITPFGSTAFNLVGGNTYLVQVSANLNIPSPVAAGDPVNPTLQIRVGGTSSFASVQMIGTDINAPAPVSSDLFTGTLYAYITVPRNTVQSLQAVITGFNGLNVTAIAGTINILEII